MSKNELEKAIGIMRARYDKFMQSVDMVGEVVREYPSASLFEDIHNISDCVENIKNEMTDIEILLENAGDFYADEIDEDDYDE